MVVRHGDHPGTQFDPLGLGRDVGEKHLRAADDLIPGGVVLADPDLVEAQFLEPDDLLHVTLQMPCRVDLRVVDRGIRHGPRRHSCGASSLARAASRALTPWITCSDVPAGTWMVLVTRYSRGTVSRVLEGGTQGRSVEKKFNWPGRARMLRLAPGTPSPSHTASATPRSSTSPSAWHGACQEVPHQRGD